MHSKFLRLKNSIYEVKLVPHFPVLHFPPLHFRSCIFRSCIFHPVFSVLHFPVLHFQSCIFRSRIFLSCIFLPWKFGLIFQWCRSLFDLSGPSLVPHFPVLHFQSTPCIYSNTATCLVTNLWRYLCASL